MMLEICMGGGGGGVGVGVGVDVGVGVVFIADDAVACAEGAEIGFEVAAPHPATVSKTPAAATV